MKTNLSSQITLNRVSPRYYRPENAFERSVLTRLEKIPTDIYETPEEGANQIAQDIAQHIRDKQKAGRFCVLALAGGNSPRNVYSALVRMHREEGLSFRNVIVFNLYEYYPLASDAVTSNLNALKEMLLDHVDIDQQNIFSPDGSIAKDTIFEYCRLYEQRIESFGGPGHCLTWQSDAWATSGSTNRAHGSTPPPGSSCWTTPPGTKLPKCSEA